MLILCTYTCACADDDAWSAKYPPAPEPEAEPEPEPADPYEWMHTGLARCLNLNPKP